MSLLAEMYSQRIPCASKQDGRPLCWDDEEWGPAEDGHAHGAVAVAGREGECNRVTDVLFVHELREKRVS